MTDMSQQDDVCEMIPSVSVFLEQVIGKSDAETEPTQLSSPTSMTNSNSCRFNKDKDFERDNIFKKLKQAQKFAENQVQECMTIASAEIVRLRDLHAETKRDLDSQIIAWKARAETELNKRIQLEKEIEVMTNQKLRAEHICNEANRQCEFLGRENACLLQDLQAGRLKLAHVDAQRRDFHQQLATLRATLGLLSREPVPQLHLSREPRPSPFLSHGPLPTPLLSRERSPPPPCAPPRFDSNFGMSENPQVQYPSASLMTTRLAANETPSLPRPAWLASPNECDSVKVSNSSNSDDTAEVPPPPPPLQLTSPTDDACKQSAAVLSDAYDDSDFDVSESEWTDFAELSDDEVHESSIAEEICVSPMRTPKQKSSLTSPQHLDFRQVCAMERLSRTK